MYEWLKMRHDSIDQRLLLCLRTCKLSLAFRFVRRFSVLNSSPYAAYNQLVNAPDDATDHQFDPF